MVSVAESPYKGQKALDPVHSADPADLQGKGTSLQGGTVPKPCGQERLGTEQLSSMVFVSPVLSSTTCQFVMT